MPPTMRYPQSGLTSGCGGVVQTALGEGEYLQSPVRYVLQDVPEHFAVPCRLQFQIQVEVHDGEGRTFRQCGQSQVGIGVDVFLAQFDESTTWSKYLYPALNRFARKRIENDI